MQSDSEKERQIDRETNGLLSNFLFSLTQTHTHTHSISLSHCCFHILSLSLSCIFSSCSICQSGEIRRGVQVTEHCLILLDSVASLGSCLSYWETIQNWIKEVVSILLQTLTCCSMRPPVAASCKLFYSTCNSLHFILFFIFSIKPKCLSFDIYNTGQASW